MSVAASKLEELAKVNLRSRRAQVSELPRAREAAILVRKEMTHLGNNPFEQISTVSASRAATFSVRLCESALEKGLPSDLKHALWLVVGLDLDSENRSTIHFCAAVIQAARIMMSIALRDVERELEQIRSNRTWDFLRKFLERPDDPQHVLAAYGIVLTKDASGVIFKQAS